MRTIAITLVLASLLMAACAPQAPETPRAITPAAGSATSDPNIAVTESAGMLHFDVQNVQISLNRPEGWEVFPTEYGVLVAEHVVPMQRAGMLDGMLLYVFVPGLEDFELPAEHEINLALHVFEQVLERPYFLGAAVAGAPVAFVWGEHHAAYYLANERDTTVMIVVGVALPNAPHIVTCNITAPASSAAQLRAMLPHLLDNLTINGVRLTGTALDAALPDPLPFPGYEEIARSAQSRP